MTTFLVPATARADVTDVGLSVAFDRLSADRVATVTVKARSESGITDAKAIVEHRTDDEEAWTSIATVPLVLVDGTANDGTWQARYQTDIEAHPGTTRFLAELTTSGGVTRNPDGKTIDNCYTTSVVDVTGSPRTIDADTPLMIAGRVLVQKTRDAAPAPIAGVPVWNYKATVSDTTAADGSFSFTHLYDYFLSLDAYVGLDLYDRWCASGKSAPAPEITRQSVELSAEIVTPQPVKVGDEVTVEGRLLRHGADGLVPVAGQWVDVRVASHGTKVIGNTHTAGDGTYRLTFTAQEPGVVTVWSGESEIVRGDVAFPGEIAIEGAPVLSEVSVTPAPVDHGQPIRATGLLADAGTPVADARVWLLFSPDGMDWESVQEGKTTSAGRFDIQSTATTTDGYWRLLHVGTLGKPVAASAAKHVKIRYPTLVDEYTVAAGPGGTVDVKGRLLRQDGSPLGTELPVNVYFMAEGGSTWEFQGTVESDAADGSFEKRFPVYEDGYWTAAFWGDESFGRSNAPIAHVDVPGQYTTAFAEFGASPTPVDAGKAITVRGLLTRSVDGGAAEGAPEKPVHVYFLPDGAQEWQQMGVVRTNADGRFGKGFTAEQDGHWTAWFHGDEGHLSINSGSKYVDVR
ncbi:hypothetical protein [Actinomadura sp. WMMB 499]|uniref:hypothetical protein n=1 Tax=Actinomadura sp. WMMB 499 TaxID=1219491 RepID=UPI001247FBA0|nr:hypothetical protein [Actinomadura sp. WMMB 499]QFG22034.1 hypothetical protein F7P10_13780 [Actinomadura sp. WMMB 499]